MRLMLKFTIPVEKGNEAAADGTIGPAIEAMIEQVQAEAAYFTVDEGKRAGFIFFDETDPTQLTKINEPLFAKLNAAISVQPVLSLEELKKSLPGG